MAPINVWELVFQGWYKAMGSVVFWTLFLFIAVMIVWMKTHSVGAVSATAGILSFTFSMIAGDIGALVFRLIFGVAFGLLLYDLYVRRG